MRSLTGSTATAAVLLICLVATGCGAGNSAETDSGSGTEEPHSATGGSSGEAPQDEAAVTDPQLSGTVGDDFEQWCETLDYSPIYEAIPGLEPVAAVDQQKEPAFTALWGDELSYCRIPYEEAYGQQLAIETGHSASLTYPVVVRIERSSTAPIGPIDYMGEFEATDSGMQIAAPDGFTTSDRHNAMVTGILPDQKTAISLQGLAFEDGTSSLESIRQAFLEVLEKAG